MLSNIKIHSSVRRPRHFDECILGKRFWKTRSIQQHQVGMKTQDSLYPLLTSRMQCFPQTEGPPKLIPYMWKGFIPAKVVICEPHWVKEFHTGSCIQNYITHTLSDKIDHLCFCCRLSNTADGCKAELCSCCLTVRLKKESDCQNMQYTPDFIYSPFLHYYISWSKTVSPKNKLKVK